MPKWILFFQTPYNNDMVKYITDELGEPSWMHYYKFVKFIHNFTINDEKEMINMLDKFKTVHIDFTSGKWEVIESEYETDVPFYKLAELNQPKEDDLPLFERARAYMGNFLRKRSQAKDDRERIGKTNTGIAVSRKRVFSGNDGYGIKPDYTGGRRR